MNCPECGSDDVTTAIIEDDSGIVYSCACGQLFGNRTVEFTKEEISEVLQPLLKQAKEES